MQFCGQVHMLRVLCQGSRAAFLWLKNMHTRVGDSLMLQLAFSIQTRGAVKSVREQEAWESSSK